MPSAFQPAALRVKVVYDVEEIASVYDPRTNADP